MSPQPATSNQRPATSNGFTLMEILLAFLILGIVLTTVLASFNAVFSTTDTLNSSSRFYEMAKSCLNRMTLDLEAFYALQPPLYKKPEFDDPPDPYRFVGSNTEKVVRTASVPVLVIKHRRINFNINKMVFACDFSKEFIPAFEKARELADMFGSDLKLVYVNTPDRFLRSSEMEAKAFEFLAAAGHDAINMYDDIKYYSDTTVEDGIFNFSSNYNADAIAVPTHGRRGLAHFFTGSIGEEMVNHSEIPVITFKIK